MVCHDVKIEPELLPIEADNIHNGNNADKARLDVSGIGIWGSNERTYIDVRIMHPNSPTYINKPIERVYKDHEDEKKRSYNGRVIQVDKGTFTPFVMSTSGGMGVEAHKIIKQIATLIADKKKEKYSDVVNHIRTRLRFSLLRSVLIAIRGVRGKSRKGEITPISALSFNLLDNGE